MDKILVTTDFSTNSKAGIRFAIQLASQYKFELTFFHSYYVMKPSSWSDKTFNEYEKDEAEKIQMKLNKFVASIYKSIGAVPKQIKCKVKSSVDTEISIIEYAIDNKFNFICISTRGAGTLKKMFGSNTSNLINHSTVPVIVVPHTYRKNKLSSILYASDLANLEIELKKVVAFAKPLKAKVELLHFNSLTNSLTESKIIANAVKKFSKFEIKLQLEKVSLENTLISNIDNAVKKSKPSLLIMFTQQNKSLFDRIFLSSKSLDYSFNTKVPLLIFNKI